MYLETRFLYNSPNELDDGWPESEQEPSHKCMYDFHQDRECDRDSVCGNVREEESEGKRKRGCGDMKISRWERRYEHAPM